MPTLADRAEAAMSRLSGAVNELEALHMQVDPGVIGPWDTPDERDVVLAEQVAEAAELGVARLWDSVRARVNNERRKAA